jgi:hypothetical protein
MSSYRPVAARKPLRSSRQRLSRGGGSGRALVPRLSFADEVGGGRARRFPRCSRVVPQAEYSPPQLPFAVGTEAWIRRHTLSLPRRCLSRR